MPAVGSSGLNWMTKLSWKAMGCYRRVSFVTCIRRSVLRHGRALEEKGLQLVSCCQAAKMRMTGWISCYRRRTFGLPLQPGHPRRGNLSTGIQQRAAKAAGPTSLEGGQVTVGGAAWPNVRQCTHREIQRRTRCSALWQGRQGRLAKIGWHSLKNKVYRLSMTSRRYWRRFQTRTQQHSRKLMHSWRIVQKGGRRERVRINSSVDVFQTLETRLGIKVLILIWLTSEHGQRGELLLGGREPLRGWEGRVCFTCFTQFANFPGLSAWLGARVCGCCLLVGFVFQLFFFSGKFVFTINSSCWPTMSCTSPAMQEKKTHLSPTCGNSQSKTKRFDDRLSFERARHGPKKKSTLTSQKPTVRPTYLSSTDIEPIDRMTQAGCICPATYVQLALFVRRPTSRCIFVVTLRQL